MPDELNRSVLCCCLGFRPPGVRAMHLLGVMLMLPEPELDYFKALARVGNDFVVEMESRSTQPGRDERRIKA